MDRKRKEKVKQDLTLSIDPDLIKQLNQLKLNKSALFTCAAQKALKKYDKDTSKTQK